MKKKIVMIALVVLLIAAYIFLNIQVKNNKDERVAKKPVIYLYPTEKTDISVKLNYQGRLTCTYPEYKDGWNVMAEPDGTLTDQSGMAYSYLFWEGKGEQNYDLSKGFVVKGNETAAFLQEKLLYMGLSPKECGDFITFWLPQMQENPYNFISFQNDFYQKYAKSTVTPKPDSEVYVYMVYKPLDKNITVKPQILTKQTRTGFTLVEWGGVELPK